MSVRIYHGSENIIETPEYGKGARHNDYGKGFYCTENVELAKEWACAKQKNGYANIYDMDMSGLKILNLNSSEYNILNWLAILADNRTYWQNGSIAEQAKNYIKKNEREREARREYRRSKRNQADVNDLFILDIMREEIKNGDARLSL